MPRLRQSIQDQSVPITMDIQLSLSVLILTAASERECTIMTLESQDRILKLFAQCIQLGHEIRSRGLLKFPMAEKIEQLSIVLLSTLLRDGFTLATNGGVMSYIDGFIIGAFNTKQVSQSMSRLCRRFVEHLLVLRLRNQTSIDEAEYKCIESAMFKSLKMKPSVGTIQTILTESKSPELLLLMATSILMNANLDPVSLPYYCDLLVNIIDALLNTRSQMTSSPQDLREKRDKFPAMPTAIQHRYFEAVQRFLAQIPKVPSFVNSATDLFKTLDRTIRLVPWMGSVTPALSMAYVDSINSILRLVDFHIDLIDAFVDLLRYLPLASPGPRIVDLVIAALDCTKQGGLSHVDNVVKRMSLCSAVMDSLSDELHRCIFARLTQPVTEDPRFSQIQGFMPVLFSLNPDSMATDWESRFHCLSNARSGLLSTGKLRAHVEDLLELSKLMSSNEAYTKNNVTALAEDITPEHKAAHVLMASLYSCFGTDALRVNFEKRFKLALGVKMDSTYIVKSNLWTLESLIYCHRGRLDMSTFIYEFYPAIEECNKKMRDSGPETADYLIASALKKQLWDTMPVFFNHPSDIAPTLTSQRGLNFIKALCVTSLTAEEVKIVVNSFSNYLHTLNDVVEIFRGTEQAKEGTGMTATLYRVFVWQQFFLWAADKAKQPGLLSEACKLMETCAACVEPKNIVDIVKLMSPNWAEDVLNGSIKKDLPPHISLELTCTSLLNGMKHDHLCKEMEGYIPRALKGLQICQKNADTDLAVIRSLHRILIRVLELFVSCSYGDILKIEGILLFLKDTQKETRPTMWKTRMNVHLAVVRYIESLVTRKLITSDLCDPLVTYLLRVVLLEAAFKCSSFTGVTQRRAHRLLDRSATLVVDLRELQYGKGTSQGSHDVTTLLLGGLAGVESIQLQRGFLKAVESLLDIGTLRLAMEDRKKLVQIVEISSGVVFNLEKRSAREARSERSGSTRYTARSSMTRKTVRSRRSRL
eukprot:Blabericola_migrator_1__3576@NODE_2063_length_3344_cov_152_324687_g1308_i0_p1_GENE_NODE_2063_length_3344_cov_152_324687_g1308_i0NODE_2063_length_3344_cov_152_324687_g1308_i0_p1_ORF_typecomplete_len1069_score240_88NUC173/PF08161_12/2_6e03NUC173/PF08161_12/4_3e08_NODE_2063_length_3344_cov_152_324687_g1308_i01383092